MYMNIPEPDVYPYSMIHIPVWKISAVEDHVQVFGIKQWIILHKRVMQGAAATMYDY